MAFVVLLVSGCGRSAPLAFDEDARELPLPVPHVGAPTSPPPTPTPTPAPLCDPDDTTLLACFGFEGNVSDGSSFGRIPTTASVGYGAGIDGSALVLTATTGFVLPDASELDPPNQTFEVWLNADVLPAATLRMGIMDKDGQYGVFLRSDGSLTCSCSGATLATTPAGAVSAGTWHHVACNLAPAGQRIYVDGVLAASVASACDPSTGADSGVYIGENGTAGDDQFLGRFDRLRIWSDARTELEFCTEAGTCENED